MRFFIVVFFILFSFFSCKSDAKLTVDVSTIEVDFSVKRYEVDFYNTMKEDLPGLKNKYPYFELLKNQNFVTIDSSIIKLTAAGYAICDEILKELL